MAKELILAKYGEMALKGLNRGTFEDILMKHLRRRLHDAQADIESRAVYGFGYKLVAP